MTRILFLPDDSSIILLETRLLPAALVNAVTRGTWHPPEADFHGLNHNPSGQILPQWSAVQLGKIVVILPEPHPGEDNPAPVKLSPRQHQVLNLMVCGLSTKQIASKLHLSPRSVFFHVAALKARLQVESRVELVKKALEFGLLDENSSTVD